MRVIYLALVAVVVLGCDKDDKKLSLLIGEWNHSYQIQQKDSTGAWGEWQTILTTVALPPIEFTKNGKILSNGKQATNCCQYLSYKLVNDTIVLSDMTPSELCNCIKCDKWIIETLTSETLEINYCYAKERYYRAK